MLQSVKRVYPTSGLWRHGDFTKLWVGQSISQFGTPISQLALPFIAIKILNASAFEVAALTTVEFLPFLLFALPAGVWVDRLSRRSVLIVGDVGRALLLLSVPVAYVLDVMTLEQLYVVGFLVGILTVFFDVAYQAYLPSLVQREQIIEGNSKLEVSRSASGIGGPGVGGGLISLLTAPYALLADAVSYVVSGGFLIAIRKREVLPERAEGARPRMRAELWEGLRYVVKHPLLRPQAMCTGTSNFFWNMGEAVYLVYVVRELHLSAAAVGLIFSLASFGWLFGAMAAQRLSNRLGAGRTTLLMSMLFGPPFILVPLAPESFPYPLLVASGLIGAFGAVVYNVIQVSLRQAITPERMQGRMNAVMRFLVWGTIPLGALAGGALGSTIGLRETFYVASAGGLLAVLPIVFSEQRKLVRIPEPEEAPSPTEAAAAGVVAVSPATVTPDA